MTDKYLLFAGYEFYPDGGWEDFIGFYDSLKECTAALHEKYPEPYLNWCHVVKNGEVVMKGKSVDRNRPFENSSKQVWFLFEVDKNET